ncbi:Snf7-domain-containing protein [Punctularia strigosozonata HHB-11173 SS5]|uniref:Snf7-domain-containing protein n=1 Tax=Punctularia strigosozonata (strain HHB-11173) TaxID=741275 RepID=UPI00044169DB|nr:Snf7-domain-containing protein [Punctularia strigosozonata HHB-11173 SS5]EIN07599.1 Snf7-domain-containing protein [Punctularia strigosozonata HHB-11173 SS5]
MPLHHKVGVAGFGLKESCSIPLQESVSQAGPGLPRSWGYGQAGSIGSHDQQHTERPPTRATDASIHDGLRVVGRHGSPGALRNSTSRSSRSWMSITRGTGLVSDNGHRAFVGIPRIVLLAELEESGHTNHRSSKKTHLQVTIVLQSRASPSRIRGNGVNEKLCSKSRDFAMNIIETLFGRTVTPAERLRQHQRALAKAQRELDRERMKLEQQEKKLVADIKKSAKSGQLNACKIMAKDLVRTRRYVQKFYQMRTQLQAVGLRIQTLRSNQQMAEAMRGATRAMASMNRGLNLPQIQKIMNEFEKESSMMDMKEEMMSDAVDDVMEDDLEDEEEEGDKILKEVLDEIGVDLSQQLTDAPTGVGAVASPLTERRQAVAMGESAVPPASQRNDVPGGGLSDEDALQARLDALRR